jgi:hypothetical protein
MRVGRSAAFALTALFTLFVLTSAQPATAQDDPRSVPHPVSGVNSSPFNPPAEDVFVTNAGPGLDTGCTFNTDPEHPLIIDVLVDRAVGAVDGDGFLVDPTTLVARGIVPANVEVIMPAYDVDVNGTPPPENDEVLLNGELLGSLTGDNNIWKLNSFSVPIGKIKFPVPPAPNSTPAPAINRIRINVDTLSTGRWCTAIDWIALVTPIELPTAVKLEPTAGNRIRENGSHDTIDVIYEESFDADCNRTTDVGPYDEVPFSGPAENGAGGSGTARLHVTLDTCPINDHLTPEVRVDWEIGGTSLSGSTTWSGLEGDVDLKMPATIGVYDVELELAVDGTSRPSISRKLFVTRKPPLSQVDPPRLVWYEKAVDWAAGEQQESGILSSLLSELYSFGGANWRYGYNFGPVVKCGWTQLVADPIPCDYADCFVFSDVFENMAATLGIGGLSAVTPLGAHHLGFLTDATPSLDPAFPGSAKPVGSSTYDRYVFSSHSLRLKSKYYDSTFNGIYTSSTEFITANLNGSQGSDADGTYRETDENWNLYQRSGNSYDSWSNYDYKAPAPFGPLPGSVKAVSHIEAPGIVFTGDVEFELLDEDLDGVAEGLIAEVEVEVDAMGQYTITGQLEKSGQLIANRPFWESMLSTEAKIDEISGIYDVPLRFSGEQIFRAGEDGPFEVVLTAIGTGSFSTTTLPTPAFEASDFGEVDARLTSVSESAVDDDGDGDLDFVEVLVDLDFRLEGDFRLQGSLDKDGETIADAGATLARAAGAQQAALRFDGARIRRSGVDGPYDGNVNLIDAEGHTLESIQFTTGPYSAASFSGLVEPSGPFSDQGVDTDGNGLFDLLRVEFGVDVSLGGTYLLTGVLSGTSSSAVVHADSLVTVAAGPAGVVLEFSGPVLHALELDGPYEVELLVREPGTLRDLDALSLPQKTAAYEHTDFDPFGASDLSIVLTGNSDDQGVDTDGNGLYDELHVLVEVVLADSDLYEWSARLVDSEDTEIGFFTSQASFAAGVNHIDFVFDGEQIGTHGADGPYFVKGLLIFGTGGANLVSVDVAETKAYSVIEFEGADLQAPQIVVADRPASLWPADHQYRVAMLDASGPPPFDEKLPEPVGFVVGASDDLDPSVTLADVVITHVTSDEPDDAPGRADDRTVDDVVIAPDCRSVMLRAERLDGGNGRVYTIHLAATDASGNTGTATYDVYVPIGSAGSIAVDDGPDHVVEGCVP